MTWKSVAIAAIAMIVGAVIGYIIAGKAIKALRKKIRQLQKDENPKKMGAMDKILILEAVILILYTITDFVVFWHTGSEPYTLTTCVFAVCGLENGVMGWIKTNKDKVSNQDTPGINDPPGAG
ncbi:MAG: LapA family protein [Lachnospiraceae bacterium]|nr:LapA family protein [Lachnospiraceae bacterium]